MHIVHVCNQRSEIPWSKGFTCKESHLEEWGLRRYFGEIRCVEVKMPVLITIWSLNLSSGVTNPITHCVCPSVCLFCHLFPPNWKIGWLFLSNYAPYAVLFCCRALLSLRKSIFGSFCFAYSSLRFRRWSSSSGAGTNKNRLRSLSIQRWEWLRLHYEIWANEPRSGNCYTLYDKKK